MVSAKYRPCLLLLGDSQDSYRSLDAADRAWNPPPIIGVWTTFGMAFLEQANGEVVNRDSQNL